MHFICFVTLMLLAVPLVRADRRLVKRKRFEEALMKQFHEKDRHEPL